ncbi:hypothetical protein M0638_06555 [Roseomonas sp. NAR14]|uniref:Tetratricopeptide repeat protein n=1 Tax=Roseomonas acroporae TaxID=2937791 RepID=A0A9X1Y884_9PROT|nr:tetratricopeptide repeat protein [Roseomonas acroporae]MCK8784040.1 hypothetical protein [Roseomonas acroporae]
MRRLALLLLLPAAALAQPAGPARPDAAPPRGAAPGSPAPVSPGAAAAAPRGAEARRAELDRLFDALRTAPDEASAALVEMQIRAAWSRAASPAVLLLMSRGQRDLRANEADEALEGFGDALVLAPDYADGWVAHAQARAALGDVPGAARDLREALRLEPRHFGALLALASLQESTGDLTGALRSLEAALAISPKLPGGEARRRDLRRRALGDNT